MYDLDITWPDGSARFTPADSPIRIGRSSEAAVPLSQGSVSRRHLEVSWNGAAWTVSDTSTHGTFDSLGIRLAPHWTLNDDVTIRLGGLGGVEVAIRVQRRTVAEDPGDGSAEGLLAEPVLPLAADAGGPFSVEPNLSPAAESAAAGPGAEAGAAEPAIPGLFAEASSGTPSLHGSDLDGSASQPTPALLDFDPPDVPAAAPPGSGGGSALSKPSFERAGDPRSTPGTLADPPAAAAGSSGLVDSPSAPPGSSGPAATPSAPGRLGELPPVRSSPGDPPGGPPPPAPPPAPGGFADARPPASPGGPPGGAATPLLPPVPGGSAGHAPPPSDAPSAFQGAPPPPAGPGTPGPPPVLPPPIIQPPGVGQPPHIPAAPGPATARGPSETIISDATIRIHVDGQDYSFLPGAEVTVGRDPSCLVKLDERHSLVSRRHMKITFRDNAWWIEDFSSKGTFIDGRLIKGPYKAEGAFVANLGDDDAGTPMRIITAGQHRVPSSRNNLAIAALAAVALIPLAILAFILTRGGSGSDEPDFASAKQSTVMLFGEEGGQGSGFFVDDDLIVTNQHVAALSPRMWVAVSRNADEPAQIEYATELVANHPFLDISVLRISSRVAEIADTGPVLTNGPVGDIGLPVVTIGDSNEITLGDEVFSTGFPGRLSITSLDDMGDLRLPPVSATAGQAASFTIWPGCSNPAWEAFIPVDSPPGVTCSGSGDVDRGVLVSTFSSGQGASGSAVYRSNEVVAVVFAGSVDEANASLNITTSAFADWLQEVIDANG